jgi:hypothetical protein
MKKFFVWGWSVSTGMPGQFTPVWGGHFDRFLQCGVLNVKKDIVQDLQTYQ